MKDIFTVTKFTIRDMIGRKSFRISTIIILVLIVIGFNIPNLLQNFTQTDDSILLVDEQKIFANSLDQIETACPSCAKIKITDSDLDTIKSQIDSGDADSAIIVERENNSLTFRYLTKNSATATIPENTINYLETIYKDQQLKNLKLSPSQLATVQPTFNLVLEQTDQETIGGNIFVMMMLSVALFFAIYFCAYQVSSSVTVEKTSKIIETLVTSTSPHTIILGKTFGIGLVGLFQMSIFAITAVISAYTFLDRETLNTLLDLSNFTPFLAITTIIYFILGYFVYAFGYALTGATISKPEDIQAANTPIALLSMIGFYLAYFTLMNPTGDLNLLASLLPISSPFCMSLRIMMGIASPTDIILSILILVITCVLVAHIAIKIYSNAILHYGTRMSWRDIIKSYKEK